MKLKFLVLFTLATLILACDRSPDKKALLIPIVWSELHAVELESFMQAVRFEKDETANWRRTIIPSRLQKVSGFETPAPNSVTTSPKTLTDFLSHLAVIELQAPIAQNTAPERFEINTYSPQIRFYGLSGTVLAEIFLGKKGSDQNSTYVMKGGDPNVYWVESDLRTPFFQLLTDPNTNGTAQEKN